MQKNSIERRLNRRYDLHLPVHYKVSQKGGSPAIGTGTTKEMSTNGLSFRCRRALPVGAHVELVIDWPARYGDMNQIDLVLTGFVVRADTTRAAVRITSRRFRILPAAAEPYRVSA